jgi:hypothetical protein
MDITIKVISKEGELYSKTFIGDKDKILPSMQEYIKENNKHYIDVFFSCEEETKELTFDELFNPQ